uniref:Uncharacterized protein n=1 Tax=Haptolina brevifila TaxID=156173 RepID=A0A7S2CZK5_9EUKA|eukprot:CAMPEP_0174728784 /NCGR_PEP_ID=MMETSP1094-20130205/52423_1 /TAXON_ID=156173 /ORGANISM="Chrysochromulina brevifilum, Strain UTEX LB 985" /LENGTH=173 /DNA_ID=CAMNT_0015930779 /DNA_START=72 /DNA_END=593 /DNA_ORIENTATION=+
MTTTPLPGMAVLSPSESSVPQIDSAAGLRDKAENFYLYLTRPGVSLDRSTAYMDRSTGQITYPISGMGIDPLLAFAFAATRFGGLLPDELPFNLVQKAVRAALRPLGIPFFDLRPGDERLQWQDTWYGTGEEAKLPFGMARRPTLEEEQMAQRKQQALERQASAEAKPMQDPK